jgi:hypothetical protein
MFWPERSYRYSGCDAEASSKLIIIIIIIIIGGDIYFSVF